MLVEELKRCIHSVVKSFLDCTVAFENGDFVI